MFLFCSLSLLSLLAQVQTSLAPTSVIVLLLQVRTLGVWSYAKYFSPDVELAP